MIRSTYDPGNNIISTHYSGRIDKTEILEYIANLNLARNLPPNLLYFEDQSQAEFIFKASDVKNIVYTLYTKISSLHAIRVAVLSSNPKETAFIMIASRLLKAKNIHTKVFYTEQAAYNWLLPNMASSSKPAYSNNLNRLSGVR